MTRICSLGLIVLLGSTTAILADEATLFSRLDANRDGYVSAEEVGEEDQRLFARLVRQADRDGDDRLSSKEFTAGISARPPQGDNPANVPNRGGQFNLAEVFRRLDRNGDQKLARTEVPERLRPNFDRYDENNDGGLQMPELIRGVASLRQNGQGQTPRPQTPANRVPSRQQAVKFAERVFDQGDRNKDGKLSLSEVPEQRRANFRRLLDKVDDDNDQAVTRAEFVEAISRAQAMRPK